MMLGQMKNAISWLCGLGLFVLLMSVLSPDMMREASVTIATTAEPTAVVAPIGLAQRAGDRSVILHWEPVSNSDLSGYRIYRSASSESLFEPRHASLLTTNHFVDFEVENDHTYHYRVRAVDVTGQESGDSETISATPTGLDAEAFLDLVQQTAFDYFWYEANPANGLIKDRNTKHAPASIAAVGFGLSALTIGVDRGWISREAGRQRVHTTLSFFWNSTQSPEPDATGYKGFYYHFLDMQTGRRTWDSELSTIDTALLLSGMLHVQQYFDRDHLEEIEIRSLVDALYHRVEWTWMQVRAPKISHGWKPETGFIRDDWEGYNEAMILYLIALGSPTDPVNPDAWTAWTSTYTWETHYGYDFVTFPPLFGHQYSHGWIDFRHLSDAYMRAKGIDYFENSRRATLANRAYAIDNLQNWSAYGENVWGLTASDIPTGYSARGAAPAFRDDGTITPTAAGGSFVFTPYESQTALRYMYSTYRTKLWGPYGFKDAFNPSANWFAADYIGIDQGPFALMIENHRTGRVWDMFMQNAAIQRGLEQAGFVRLEKVAKSQTTTVISMMEAKRERTGESGK